MRITTQPAAELATATTATANVSATPASPANFGAALAVASAANAPAATHSTPDHVDEKRSNHSKTSDAEGSASASQTLTTQLANVVMPTPMPIALAPPAPVQNDASQYRHRLTEQAITVVQISASYRVSARQPGHQPRLRSWQHDLLDPNQCSSKSAHDSCRAILASYNQCKSDDECSARPDRAALSRCCERNATSIGCAPGSSTSGPSSNTQAGNESIPHAKREDSSSSQPSNAVVAGVTQNASRSNIAQRAAAPNGLNGGIHFNAVSASTNAN